MTEAEWYQERKTAIHMLRSGTSASEVAQHLKRSLAWVYKWQQRFEAAGWDRLHSCSRVPQHSPTRLAEPLRQRICQVRSELEAEAHEPSGLGYIGAGAIRGRLKDKGRQSLPSTASIERVLHAAGMTHPRRAAEAEEDPYPRLHPTEPGTLCQVDIVPHYLKGGTAVACFNAIDVASRYPTGQAFAQRRSVDAQAFLIHVWQTLGLSQYTQVDNEGCFSGGFTHPGVLGKVLRLALYVGTELVFSPVRHPQSNGSVERFHQDYDQHVWKDTDLQDRADVQKHAAQFFAAYRRSRHHSALQGHRPTETHAGSTRQRLSPTFTLPAGKLPLTEGRVHFMRQVTAVHEISVLNLMWSVPETVAPGQGVWATLEFRPSEAHLQIYDQAPDAASRSGLVQHAFDLQEAVVPLCAAFRVAPAPPFWKAVFATVREGLAYARMALSTMF